MLDDTNGHLTTKNNQNGKRLEKNRQTITSIPLSLETIIFKKNKMKLNFLPQLQMIAPALVAAGVAAASAGAQTYAQGKMNKKTREFSEKMYNKQRQDAITDFDKTNQYNSPAQQMQRLREAGLNPHLIYGGGGATSNAAPIRGADYPTPEQRTPNVGAILTDPVNAYIETQRFTGQQALINAQTLKTLAETDTKNFDLGQKQKLADTQAKLLESILQGKQIDNYVNVEKNARENVKLTSDLAEATQRIAKSISDIDLQGMMKEKGNEEIKNIQQMRTKVDAEVSNLIKDGRIKDFEIKLNQLGFTKSDPIYARLAQTLVESIGLTPDAIKKKVNDAVEGTKEAVKKAGAIQDVILRTLIPGY